ncbi:Cytoplasmic protein NCK2 [Taenia crassiceps]|uniref:Cytoplasmic protein NCK2 n=1 Tax=Taenia crassiceps TaxID=6207 RepID=A0ABR4QSQ3_9CEST
MSKISSYSKTASSCVTRGECSLAAAVAFVLVCANKFGCDSIGRPLRFLLLGLHHNLRLQIYGSLFLLSFPSAVGFILTNFTKNVHWDVLIGVCVRPGDLTITMNAGTKNRNFKVHVKNGEFYIGQKVFSSVDALIDNYRRHPIYKSDLEKHFLTRPFQHPDCGAFLHNPLLPASSLQAPMLMQSR